jgi:hypothetical protein
MPFTAVHVLVAQPGHGAVVRRRLLLGVERTCRSSGPTSEFDPQRTSASISCRNGEGGFQPLSRTRLSR